MLLSDNKEGRDENIICNDWRVGAGIAVLWRHDSSGARDGGPCTGKPGRSECERWSCLPPHRSVSMVCRLQQHDRQLRFRYFRPVQGSFERKRRQLSAQSARYTGAWNAVVLTAGTALTA